jgi:hypothetical protein
MLLARAASAATLPLSRVGAEVQPARPGWSHRPQGPGTAVTSQRCTSGGSGRYYRERADAGDHGVVRWRIIDLCQWMFEEFRVTIAKQTLSREGRKRVTRRLVRL